MNKDYAVKFTNVSKIYNIDKTKDKFYALKDINLEIPKGQSVGILGTNGSGKSTISRILAGISQPDEGSVDIIGEQALIAINSGFNNKLTGRENIELKGVLLGFSKQKIKEITESVIEFSELGEFINQPVKKYSSGMKSRLGFSISINLDPEIVIVDEALSVGDKTFNEKCLSKINEMKESGKTIFFVSHSLKEMKQFCESGLWIEGGEVKAYGSIEEVGKKYQKFIKEYKEKTDEEKKVHRSKVYENRVVRHTKKPSKFKKLKMALFGA